MRALRRKRIPLLLVLAGIASSGCQQAKQAALFVVDQDAGGKGYKGAVFRLDPAQKSATLFCTSKLFRQPQDLMQQPDGSFLLLDYYDEGGVGKIFKLSRDGSRIEEAAIPEGLVDPFQFERAPDGSIWIVDKNADPLGLGKQAGEKTGTLWQLSADLQSLTVIATGPPLAAPSAIVFAGEDAYLMDADSFRQGDFDPEKGEGGIFRVRRHPEALETVVRFRSMVSPLGFHRESDGSFIVVDVNLDPVEKNRHHGALFRVDSKTGAAKVFANAEAFRDPITCLQWQGSLLVADPNADPLGLGDDGSNNHMGGKGRGGIYRVDLTSGSVTLFVASKDFVNPVRVRSIEL